MLLTSHVGGSGILNDTARVYFGCFPQGTLIKRVFGCVDFPGANTASVTLELASCRQVPRSDTDTAFRRLNQLLKRGGGSFNGPHAVLIARKDIDLASPPAYLYVQDKFEVVLNLELMGAFFLGCQINEIQGNLPTTATICVDAEPPREFGRGVRGLGWGLTVG